MTLPDSSSLGALPRSERLETLSKTGLVQHWTLGDFRCGLSIINGAIIPNHSSNEWPVRFPEELLNTNDPGGSDAKEIMLCKNRIVLDGDLQESLEFLESLGDSVKHINTLDITFRLETFEKYDNGTTTEQNW